MVRFAEVFCIQKERRINCNYPAGFTNSVKFGYSFMEAVKVFENVRGVDFIKRIIVKRIWK